MLKVPQVQLVFKVRVETQEHLEHQVVLDRLGNEDFLVTLEPTDSQEQRELQVNLVRTDK